MPDTRRFQHDPLPPAPKQLTYTNLRIGSIGFDNHQNRGFCASPRVHALFVITNGSGTYQMNDEPEQVISAGSLFTIWPGPKFCFGPNPDTTWAESFMCVHGTDIERWNALGLFPNDGKVRHLGNPRQARTKLRRLAKLRERSSAWAQDRAAINAESLLVDLKYDRIKDGKPGGNRNEDIEHILHYLKMHLEEPIDFEVVAKRFNLSYSSLRQKCRASTGLPPSKYLTALRCSRAQHWLADPSISIHHIAEMVGFEDPYTFSRVFKRTTGLSPRNWRKTFFPES